MYRASVLLRAGALWSRTTVAAAVCASGPVAHRARRAVEGVEPAIVRDPIGADHIGVKATKSIRPGDELDPAPVWVTPVSVSRRKRICHPRQGSAGGA